LLQKKKFVDLGRITSIEFNHKPLEVAKQGTEVCIRIENTTGGAPKLLGRHFLASDFLVSKVKFYKQLIYPDNSRQLDRD
jgi:translation initiation factor 5B